MRAKAEKIACRCAADSADHLALLLQLVELELIERERTVADHRLIAAKFPPRRFSMRSTLRHGQASTSRRYLNS